MNVVWKTLFSFLNKLKIIIKWNREIFCVDIQGRPFSLSQVWEGRKYAHRSWCELPSLSLFSSQFLNKNPKTDGGITRKNLGEQMLPPLSCLILPNDAHADSAWLDDPHKLEPWDIYKCPCHHLLRNYLHIFICETIKLSVLESLVLA